MGFWQGGDKAKKGVQSPEGHFAPGVPVKRIAAGERLMNNEDADDL